MVPPPIIMANVEEIMVSNRSQEFGRRFTAKQRKCPTAHLLYYGTLHTGTTGTRRIMANRAKPRYVLIISCYEPTVLAYGTSHPFELSAVNDINNWNITFIDEKGPTKHESLQNIMHNVLTILCKEQLVEIGQNEFDPNCDVNVSWPWPTIKTPQEHIHRYHAEHREFVERGHWHTFFALIMTFRIKSQ